MVNFFVNIILLTNFFVTIVIMALFNFLDFAIILVAFSINIIICKINRHGGWRWQQLRPSPSRCRGRRCSGIIFTTGGCWHQLRQNN